MLSYYMEKIEMNSTKQIELLRQRNVQLQEEVEHLRSMNFEKYMNAWEESLEELNKERETYQELINDIKNIKENLIQCK